MVVIYNILLLSAAVGWLESSYSQMPGAFTWSHTFGREHILQVLFHQNIKTPNLCISVDLGNTRKKEFSSPWNKNNFVCQSQHSPEFDKTNLALFPCKIRLSRCWARKWREARRVFGWTRPFCLLHLVLRVSGFFDPCWLYLPLFINSSYFPLLSRWYSHLDTQYHSRKFSWDVCCQITLVWCETC